MTRHPETIATVFRNYRDITWLEARRSTFANVWSLRQRSWTPQAGRTGTRAAAGFVAQRWQSGINFARMRGGAKWWQQMIPTEVMLYMLYMYCYICFSFLWPPGRGFSSASFCCASVFCRCQHTCFQIERAGIVCISREDLLRFVFC